MKVYLLQETDAGRYSINTVDIYLDKNKAIKDRDEFLARKRKSPSMWEGVHWYVEGQEVIE